MFSRYLLLLFLPVFLYVQGCDVSKMTSSNQVTTSSTAHNVDVANTLNRLDQKIGADLRAILTQKGLSFPLEEITLIGLKEEQQLELWGRNSTESEWILVKSYPFTANSGGIGPKLIEGDRQIPEGIYSVPLLNPNSNYHLSIKINYPNAFDRAQAARVGRTNLGGNIFIHGDEKTIGCIPVGDAMIEEIFHLVGMTGEANTQVIIAPYDFRQRAPINRTNLAWVDELYTDIAVALAPF